MQKKLIAVAVAGALGAPALAMAQASTVQVYGRATLEYSWVDRGEGQQSGDVLQSPGGTAIGFKGEEKLGGGLSAWFQCESSADVTEGGDGFCTRNSALGFKGGFGNLFVGRWDTPFKRAAGVGSGIGAEDTGVQGNSRILFGNSTGTTVGDGSASGRGTWKRREANSINYETPKFGGFQALGTFTSLEASSLTDAAPEVRLWSVAGIYGAGPLAVGLAYEIHQDIGGDGNDDDAWVLSGRYKFGPATIGALYSKQNFEGPAGANADVQVWHIGVEYAIGGPSVIEASYQQADDMEGTAGFTPTSLRPAAGGSDTGAKQYQIAYRHNFSKRTQARIAYVVSDNDGGTNNYFLNGIDNPSALGEKSTGISLLVKHNF